MSEITAPATPANAKPVWLEWVVRHQHGGILVLDSQAKVVFANKWFLQRAGLNEDQILGFSLSVVFSDMEGSSCQRALVRSVETGFPSMLSQSLHISPIPLYATAQDRRQNKRIRQSIQIVPMGHQESKAAGQRFTLVQINDMTHTVLREGVLKAIAAKMDLMAHMDALTGLNNRRFFDGALANELRVAARNLTPVGLIMFDIDYFKAYNDHYGHPEGDKCLKSVANALRQVSRRPRDIVARYGGEEIVIVLPETGLAGSIQVAREILQTLRDMELPHAKNPRAAHVTMSAGISVNVPDALETGILMIKHADQALYAAKAAGRDCCFFYEASSGQTIAC